MTDAADMQRITIYMRPEMILEMDRARMQARASGGYHIPRSELIIAIIESVNIPAMVAKLAKVPK